MSNILIMAKKEFTDLINSRLVILILAFYAVIFSVSFNGYYGSLDTSNPSLSFVSNPAGESLSMFTILICFYGSLVAVVLGFSSMSGEADGKALSTLLVKPLYRDTIINGKLLGAFCFAFCLFWVNAALYIVGLLWFFGSMIGPHLIEFFSLLPLAFVLYMLCSMFLFSLSMLICISFKEQSFALFLGFLSWMVLYRVMSSVTFAGYLSEFFHLDQSMSIVVSSLSPYNIVALILGTVMNGLINGKSLSLILSDILLQFFILSLYCFVTVIASYAVFIRRDVQ